MASGSSREKPSLEGVHARLDKADEHLYVLKAAMQRFLDENPYRVISEVDADTGECVLRGQVFKRPPKLAWALLIGDTIHNLRSALDHLTWQLGRVELARLGRPEEDPPDRTAFPICVAPGDFNAQRERHIGGLSSDAQTRIENLQPYEQRPNGPRATALWVLHALWNQDKHRLLHIGQSATIEFGVTADVIFDYTLNMGRLNALSTFDANGEIDRLPGVTDCAKLAAKLDFTYGITFDPEGPARGTPVISQIEACRDAVRREVVPMFLDFFCR